MFTPFSTGLFFTLSGVSPCAICHLISPLSRSIAVILPYGGLPRGNPRTVRPPPPPPSAPAASALVAAPPATDRPPPAADPLPPGRRAPVKTFPEMYRRAENPAGGGTSPIDPIAPVEYTYATCASGSNDPPFQFVP